MTPDADQNPSDADRNVRRQYALKEGDSFLIADAHGDLHGGADGLFRNDTRVMATLVLRFAGQRPSLLSTNISEDNVYFTAHMTNHPLPLLGEEQTPEGVIHIERKRFLWNGCVHERLQLVNYSDFSAMGIPISVEFSADFIDMFEVRGQRREEHGDHREPEVQDAGVVLSYEGLDACLRRSAISFSRRPQQLSSDRAEFHVDLAPRGHWYLFVDIAESPTAPGRERFRQAAAQARKAMRRRRGAKLKVSGRLFQSWLDRSATDLALLTTALPTGPYPYAGVPWFSTPFGRDAIVTAFQTLWLDPVVARGVLAFLAEHQAQEYSSFHDAEPGKIMHETRKGEMSAVKELPFAKYYGGVDTTPLFVMLAGAYLQRTGDWQFIDTLWRALHAAMKWVDQSIANSPEGFLAYARAETTGLLNQGWKDSHDSIFHEDGSAPHGSVALVEVQGYAYRAYLAMKELSQGRGDEAAAMQWAGKAEALSAAVERLFWQDDQQFYALAIDERGRPCRVRSSNAGHLLFTGLPLPARGRAVADQLMSKAFFSGWGIRTLAAEAYRFNPMSYHNGSVWPHDVAICAAGLARYGARDGAVKVLSAVFEAASQFGMRLPELFCGFARCAGEAPIAYPVACLPQAWAAGSAFMLMQACLGVSLDAQRHAVVITKPQLPTGIDRLQINRLTMNEQSIDLAFERLGEAVVVVVKGQRGPRPMYVDIRL